MCGRCLGTTSSEEYCNARICKPCLAAVAALAPPPSAAVTRDLGAAAAHAAATTASPHLACSRCRFKLPRAAFSNTQANKTDGERKCKLCVAKKVEAVVLKTEKRRAEKRKREEVV
eukprot:SAG11_NODE_17696_length_511_cov_1.007282_1_plen_115_part_01